MVAALERASLQAPLEQFDFAADYLYQEQLYGLEGRPMAAAAAAAGSSGGECSSSSGDGSGPRHYGRQWVLLRFEQPVTAPQVCARVSCT